MLQPKKIAQESNALEDLHAQALGKYDNIGDLETFRSKLRNPEKRKVFFDFAGKDLNLGSLDDFNSVIEKSEQELLSKDPKAIQNRRKGVVALEDTFASKGALSELERTPKPPQELGGDQFINNIYSQASNLYDNIGTVDEFKEKLSDPNKRKAFFDFASKDLNLGSSDDFNFTLDNALKKKEQKKISSTPVDATSVKSLIGEGSSPVLDEIKGVPEDFSIKSKLKPEPGSLAAIAADLDSENFISELEGSELDSTGIQEVPISEIKINDDPLHIAPIPFELLQDMYGRLSSEAKEEFDLNKPANIFQIDPFIEPTDPTGGLGAGLNVINEIKAGIGTDLRRIASDKAFSIQSPGIEANILNLAKNSDLAMTNRFGKKIDEKYKRNIQRLTELDAGKRAWLDQSFYNQINNSGLDKKVNKDFINKVVENIKSDYIRKSGNENKDSFILEIANSIKKDSFKTDKDYYVDLNEKFNNKMQDIAFNYLSKEEAEAANINIKIDKLVKAGYSFENSIKLKELRDQKKNILSNTSLYDPETGSFVARENADERIVEFNKKVDALTIQYSKNDVGDLKKLRDDLFFRMESFYKNIYATSTISNGVPRFRGEKIINDDGSLTTLKVMPDLRDKNKEIVSEIPTELSVNENNDDITQNYDRLMTHFNAVNKALMLNEDVSGIDRGIGHWFDNVGNAFMGKTNFNSDRSIIDGYVEAAKEANIFISPDQEARYERTLADYTAMATGATLRIAGEIVLSALVTKKVANTSGVTKYLDNIKRNFVDKGPAYKMLYNVMYDAASTGIVFGQTEAGAASGIGEGVAGALLKGSKIGKLFGDSRLGKVMSGLTKLNIRASSETVAEFVGEFTNELSETGFDVGKSFNNAFGRDMSEFKDKLALTYIMSLGFSTAYQAGSSLSLRRELEKFKGDPVVDAALAMENNGNPEDLSIKEALKAEATGKEIKKTEPVNAVQVKKEGDTEYKVDGKFFSEDEIIEKIKDPDFKAKIESGETNVEIQSPSDIVSKALTSESIPSQEKIAGITSSEINNDKLNKIREDIDIVKEELIAEKQSGSLDQEVLSSLEDKLGALKEEEQILTDNGRPGEIKAQKTKLSQDSEIINQKIKSLESDLEFEKTSEFGSKERVAEIETEIQNLKSQTKEQTNIEQDVKSKETETAKEAEVLTETPVVEESKSTEQVKPEQETIPPPLEKDVTEATVTEETKLQKAAKIQRAVANKIREGKLNKPGQLFTSSGFDKIWDLALETVATSLDGAASLTESIDSAITAVKGTDWFKKLTPFQQKKTEDGIRKSLTDQLSEQEAEAQKEIEKQVAAPATETKTPSNEKTSKVAERRAEGEGIEPERAKGLKSKNKYKSIKQADIAREANNLIKEQGPSEAANIVNNPKNNVSPAFRTYVNLQASANIESNAMKLPEGSIERQQMLEESEALLSRESQTRTQEGQANAVINEFYNNNPQFARRVEVNKRLFEGKTEALETIIDGNKTAAEVIEEIRNQIIEDIKGEFENDLESLRNKNKQLDSQIKKLQEGKAPKSKEKKPATQKEIKERFKEKKKSAIEDIKKAWKKPGSASFTVVPGLTQEMIEAVGKLVAAYVEFGSLTTAQIVSKAYNDIRAAGVDIEKKKIEEVADSNQEFNQQKAFEAGEGVADIGKEIKKTQSIESVVAQHYINKQDISKSLAQDLTNKAGLPEEEASALASKIENEVSKFLEQKTKDALNKFLSPPKEVSESQKKQKKENNKLINKVIKGVNLGALSTSDFPNAFSEKFGFIDVDIKTRAKVMDLVNEIDGYTKGPDSEMDIDTTQRELKRKAELELNNLIEKMTPKNAAFWGKLILEIQYTHVLTGMNTQVNANAGAMATSILNVAGKMASNLSSVRGVGIGIMRTINPKVIRTSMARAREARRKNFSMYDSINTLSEGATTDKQGFYEQQVLKGVTDYAKKIISDPTLKGKGKAVTQTIFQSLIQATRLTHLLKMSDAFMTSQFTEFNNTIDEYNKSAIELGATKAEKLFGSKRLIDTLNKKMAWDKTEIFETITDNEISGIIKDIENKVDKMVGNGEIKPFNRNREIRKLKEKRISKGYRSRRIKELEENQRDQESLEHAIKTSRDWIMMNDPDGIIGEAVRFWKKKSNIKETDSGARVATKTLLGSTFMFARMTGNFFNNIKTGIPVIGAFDAVLGVTRDIDTDKRVFGKWKGNKELMYRRLAVNAIVTSISYSLFKSMFKYDDDDQEWKLNPDRPIDFTSTGTGKFGKNQQLEPGHVTFGWRLRDNDGSWGIWRRSNLLPQMMGTVSVLGRMSDDLRGLGKDEEFSFQRSFRKGITSEPIASFMEGSFVSVGRIGKTISREDDYIDGLAMAAYELASNPIKNIMQPNFYKDIINEVQTSNGINKKYAKKFYEKFLYDFYGADFFLKEKTDLFGNKYPKQNKFSQWIDGYYQTYQDHPEVKLLYKFDTGVMINKYKARKNNTVFGDSFTLNDEQAIELEEIQQNEFRKLVLEDISSLDKEISKDDLSSELKRLRERSIKTAKETIFEKYFE